jgi:hypothetical protein
MGNDYLGGAGITLERDLPHAAILELVAKLIGEVDLQLLARLLHLLLQAHHKLRLPKAVQDVVTASNLQSLDQPKNQLKPEK